MHWLWHTLTHGRWPPGCRLMEGDDKRRGQLVRFPFLNADGRINAAQDMRLDGHRPVLLFHLGQDDHAGLCLVLVLGGEDFLHLVIQVVFLADVRHALYHLVMVDSLERVAIDVIFLVCAPERVERHHLDVVVLEIELHGGGRCC